mmetsp:Transcript_40884/g.63825  ORF Transcript_40884/g.63825 Transcript_40884/m.63825 type:complete len:227 (-) Transcript_40884:44-724(-)
MSDNQISTTSTSCFLQGIRGSVESLDLSSNRILGSSPLIPELVQGIPDTLTALNLSGNNLGQEGSSEIADRMKELTSLKILRLRGCWIGDDGALELSIGMAECPTLEVLDLSSNSITDSGALTEALPECANLGLKELKLSRNGLEGDQAIPLVEEFLRLDNIKTLDLDDNLLIESDFPRIQQILQEGGDGLRSRGKELRILHRSVPQGFRDALRGVGVLAGVTIKC